MKSLNRIENPLCTSIENLIVKPPSKLQSDPYNHVEVISSLRLKNVVSRKTRSKFKVIDHAQRPLRGAAEKSLAEPFKQILLL